MRAKLGSEARETAESFSVDRMAERYLDLARELLDSPKPHRIAMLPGLTSKTTTREAR